MGIVFGQLMSVLSVTLVSDGAECIRILKSFFVKTASTSLIDRLRREVGLLTRNIPSLYKSNSQVRPYVTDEELQQKLQREVDWTAYKHLLVQRIYDRNAKHNIATPNY